MPHNSGISNLLNEKGKEVAFFTFNPPIQTNDSYMKCFIEEFHCRKIRKYDENLNTGV